MQDSSMQDIQYQPNLWYAPAPPTQQWLDRLVTPGSIEISAPETNAAESEKREPAVRCAHCNATITSEKYKTLIDGEFAHFQCNPTGNSFYFGCYSKAEGCQIIGQPSTEFSWFTGFAWRIALCNQCKSHLGWYFQQTATESFYGLILSQIIRGR
ncbi:MAG: cereblon family protein [Pseudomonadales bacterium]|uniref:CULT domain-containing protein n=1 Tax=Oleiphilus messinensis TaxID=141451 RepID=A0A1Y0IEV2_9GAMM|nr:cereblon family protein [Oleiphilus messinensis]ARU57903.1 hypothetical protein OLMES_3883 [Oleiphilus messinensis]MCG8613410.1 cereblon family protein [Pseudomonadales bacterium]